MPPRTDDPAGLAATPPLADAIGRVAVIGAGARGQAFARRCAEAGLAVVLEDVLSARLRGAAAALASAPAASRNRIRLAETVEDAVREADIAVDFVPDELESKLEIFSLLDRMAPPHTVLCTPTMLSITDLASCTYRPELCVGLQRFSDGGEREVDLLQGRRTAPETSTRVGLWLAGLGYTVRHMEDQ